MFGFILLSGGKVYPPDYKMCMRPDAPTSWLQWQSSTKAQKAITSKVHLSKILIANPCNVNDLYIRPIANSSNVKLLQCCMYNEFLIWPMATLLFLLISQRNSIHQTTQSVRDCAWPKASVSVLKSKFVPEPDIISSQIIHIELCQYNNSQHLWYNFEQFVF